MNKGKKVFAALALAGMVLSTAPVQVFATTTASAGSTRLAGLTRIETAIAIADAGWSSAETAVIAPSEDEHLVDALAAAPLAGQENAPILLTEGNKLNNQTKTELVKLNVKKAYVVGAIDQSVVAELNGSGINATAIKGSDRVDTATQIAAKLTNPQGSFVVGYGALPDALSVASYAAANHYSILIADPAGKLPQAETAYAKAPAYLLGGPTLVADGAVTGAVRIAGLDRFETNDRVMAQFADTLQYEKVYVANGEDAHLVDSLVASSLAGQTKSPILLGTTKEVKAAARVGEKMTAASQTIALGGPSVVPDAVRDSVAYKAPAVLSVESATAINLMQLKVVFNKAVDKDSAEDPDNYTVEDDGDDIDIAHDVRTDPNGPVDILDGPLLQADGKTVIVTLAGVFDNPTTASLTVEGVKDLDGKEIAETEITDIAVADTTLPEVKKIEVLGSERIKVSFSEPVSGDFANKTGKYDPDNFTIDDGDYIVSEIEPVLNEPAVELSVGNDLTEGQHTIEFNDNSGAKIADVAGYTMLQTTKTFDVVRDTRPIEASVVSANQTEVVIKFNKQVKVDNENNIEIYHSSSKYTGTPDADTNLEDWESEWTIDFSDNPLPGGDVNIYIEQLDDEDDPITDGWDNVVTDEIIKLVAHVEEDETAPTVENVEVDDAATYTEFTVTYSEEVNATQAVDEDNYLLENADGDELNLYDFVLNADGDEVTFKAQEEDADGVLGKLLGGKYDLTIQDIEDVSPLENEMLKYTTTVDVEDETAPTVEEAVYNSVDKTIALVFSEEMATSGRGSIADKDNFLISFNGPSNFTELDDDDVLEVGTGDTYVIIDLSEGTLDGVAGQNWSNVYVAFAGIEDVAGNKVTESNMQAVADENPGVTEVEAGAEDEITVTFDTILDDVNAKGVSLVYADGTDTGIVLSVKSHTIDTDDDVSEVTFNLSQDLNHDGTFGANHTAVYLLVDKDETGLESVLGTPAEVTVGSGSGYDNVVVTDDISPEMDTVEVTDDGWNVIVTFTEDLNASTIASMGKNGFSVAGDGIYDYSKQIAPNKIMLVADDDDLFSDNTTVSYDADRAGIEDKSGNKLQDFNDEDVDDAAALTVATVAVAKAEASKSQADVDAAQTLVTALAGTAKNDLQARIDAVQADIDAAAAAADAADVAADLAALTLAPVDPTLGTTTIALPATGTNGSTITWTVQGTAIAGSNDTTPTTVDTSVTTAARPTGVDPSLVATLTATITKGTASDTQTFTVTVPVTGSNITVE